MATKFDFCDTKIEIKPPGQNKRSIGQVIWYDDAQNAFQEQQQNAREDPEIPRFPDRVFKDIVVSVDFESQAEDRTIWLVEGFNIEVFKFNLDTQEVVLVWTEFWEISQSPLFFYIDAAYQSTEGTLRIKWG